MTNWGNGGLMSVESIPSHIRAEMGTEMEAFGVPGRHSASSQLTIDINHFVHLPNKLYCTARPYINTRAVDCIIEMKMKTTKN